MAEGNSPLLYIDFSTFSLQDQVEGADFLLAGRSALIQVNSILRTEGTYWHEF